MLLMTNERRNEKKTATKSRTCDEYALLEAQLRVCQIFHFGFLIQNGDNSRKFEQYSLANICSLRKNLRRNDEYFPRARLNFIGLSLAKQ